MEQLILIKTVADLDILSEYLDDKDYISFDCETNGVEKDSKIIGFSISADPEIGFYVILSYWNVEAQELIETDLASYALSFLKKLVGKALIAHNAVFDCARVYDNYKIDLMESIHTDTMILAHVLDENRHNGLKELGAAIFGDDIRAEQIAVKASVVKNGGMLTKEKYELYKADPDLIGRYGAKDAVLTLKLFYHLIPELYDQKLDIFFYEEESMPLLRTSTYDLNTAGLRVDFEKLLALKGTLEVECMQLKADIYIEIEPHIKDKKKFNVSAPQQLSWLLFYKLGNEFGTLTEGGRELCKAMNVKIPYNPKDKREFLSTLVENKGRIYEGEKLNSNTNKMSKPKKIGDCWKYLSVDKITLEKLTRKYEWVEKFLVYTKNKKLLSTYVDGIQSRMRHNIIHPSFLQHGTTSGRYSSKNPNFQNLPRDDKRIKECIISRPGKVFVGADYSQLEPRVFASVSQDPTLMSCFEKGEDFYSVVGIPMFGKTECSAYKKHPNSFAEKYPELRQIAKAFALATPYGTSSFQQSMKLGKPKQECQDIIDRYFKAYPKVELMMLTSHEQAKTEGVVYSLYGRPRRIPAAKEIASLFGVGTSHGELPYEARTLCNLGVNHRIQSSAATIVNRAAIAFCKKVKGLDVKIVLQCHDELVVECPVGMQSQIKSILQDCMENTTKLDGVKLIAEPKIANNLADLK